MVRFENVRMHYSSSTRARTLVVFMEITKELLRLNEFEVHGWVFTVASLTAVAFPLNLFIAYRRYKIQ